VFYFEYWWPKKKKTLSLMRIDREAEAAMTLWVALLISSAHVSISCSSFTAELTGVSSNQA
jgi:uncharacterized membrane-anchored protein